MNSILLIGKDGQVGQDLQTRLAPLGHVVGVGREGLDLTQQNEIRQLIQTVRPHLIVNAAAYTAVDKAETEIELAHAVNATAPTVMAQAAEQIGAALIHISTDYVFDGYSHTPYTEADSPNPIGAYGKSKLAGEAGIRQIHANAPAFCYAILRTAWVYGTGGKGNFVKTMLRLGAEREEVRVVADQVGTPTWSAEIAKAIAALASHFLQQSGNPTEAQADLSGIYHFTQSGVASWYDFSVAIFEEARLLGVPLKLKRVVPITTPEYPTPAQRPAYSVLDCQKIQNTILKAPAPHWRQGLRQMLAEFYSCTYESTYESNHSLRR
jgi:dTDP-4-dehydrorhamnose reductase